MEMSSSIKVEYCVFVVKYYMDLEMVIFAILWTGGAFESKTAQNVLISFIFILSKNRDEYQCYQF